MACSTTASFVYSVDGKTVHFYNRSRTTGSGCSIKEFYWTFGTSDEEFIPDPTFTFKSYNRTYDVALEVTDSSGGVKKMSKRITTGSESATCNTNVTIGYTVDGKTVRFAGTANMASACSVRSWKWNFGDGGTSTSRYPTHTYSTYGRWYDLVLDVVDSSGKTVRGTDHVKTGAGSAPTEFDIQISGPTGASITVTRA